MDSMTSKLDQVIEALVAKDQPTFAQHPAQTGTMTFKEALVAATAATAAPASTAGSASNCGTAASAYASGCASASTYSAESGDTAAPTAIGTPSEGALKAGVAMGMGHDEDSGNPDIFVGEHERPPSPLDLATPTPISGLAHMSHLNDHARLSPLSASPHFSHLSASPHLSHLSSTPHFSDTHSHHTAYPEAESDKLAAFESVHDLLERVEAWRESLSPPAPTTLKRNKAYVGLWALGVQDLLANPVLVTAVSSPAGSHVEFARR